MVNLNKLSYTARAGTSNAGRGIGRNLKGAASLLAVFFAYVQICSVSAASSGKNSSIPEPFSRSAQRLSANAEPADALPLLRAMLAKIRSYRGYSFDSVLVTFKGKKPELETGRLYFKNPNLLRFECEKAGMRSGAVLVRQPDGRIFGKMGFAGVKMRLSPDSKLLKTANGFSILESDLESLLAEVCKRAAQDLSTYLIPAEGTKPQIIEIVEKDGDLLDRIVLNSENLPVEWSLFKDKQLFSTVIFKNLKATSDLNEQLFCLSGPGGPKDSGSKDEIENKASELIALKSARSIQGLTPEAEKEIGIVSEQMRQDTTALGSLVKSAALAGKTRTHWNPQLRAQCLELSSRLERALYVLLPVSDCFALEGRSKLEQEWQSNCLQLRSMLDRVFDLIEADTEQDAALLEELEKFEKLLGRFESLNASHRDSKAE